MKVTVLGAAKEVSGSMSLFEADTLKILVDCGLTQTNSPQKDILKKIRFDFDPSEIDYCIITHAHIDHCGLIPYLIKKGYKGPIICTEPTLSICEIALKDCAYIWSKELERMKKNKDLSNENLQALYTTEEAEYAIKSFRGYGFNKEIILNDKVSLFFRKAGHILGAASVEFNVKQEIKTSNGIEYKIRKVLFTGDISGKNDFHPFIEPVEYIDRADYVICESTYGNKKHIKIDVEQTLTDIIQKTCIDNEKTTLIASFSVQRLQELLWYLYNVYKDNPQFRKIPIYVDTPMGTNVSKQVYNTMYEFYNSEAKEKLNNGENIFEWNKITYVKDYTDSLALANGDPKIIIASAGMMQAGRITNHIDSFLPSKNCSIILTGYCAIGTFGRKLLDTINSGNNKIQTISGKELTIRANIIKIEGLSGHADSNDLVKYITHINGIKKVILNHGELDALDMLQMKLQQRINIPIIIANKNNTINLK